MIAAYNKKRCAAFPFETGIHHRRKTDFFPEEDTTKSYSGFEPEPSRLQAEDFEAMSENVLTMVIPQWLINSYDEYSHPPESLPTIKIRDSCRKLATTYLHFFGHATPIMIHLKHGWLSGANDFPDIKETSE
ncbi:hypothetical protein TNCV_2022671 [Trichonephila clavipes]|nr:hypothetical protein TNCV_2022671 [Trichonephila clavipes]